MTRFLEFILEMDRRWVFVGVVLVVIVLFFFFMCLEVGITKETR